MNERIREREKLMFAFDWVSCGTDIPLGTGKELLDRFSREPKGRQLSPFRAEFLASNKPCLNVLSQKRYWNPVAKVLKKKRKLR